MPQTIGERVKQLRKAKKMSQEKFGAALGVTTSAISLIESGKNTLTESMLRAICREFGVNEKWLRSGEGEMFHTSTKAEEIAAFVGDLLGGNSSEFQQRFVAALARMSPEEWSLLEKKARELAAELAEDPTES